MTPEEKKNQESKLPPQKKTSVGVQKKEGKGKKPPQGVFPSRKETGFPLDSRRKKGVGKERGPRWWKRGGRKRKRGKRKGENPLLVIEKRSFPQTTKERNGKGIVLRVERGGGEGGKEGRILRRT